MPSTFEQFRLGTTAGGVTPIQTDDFVVGYDTNALDGERRWPITTLAQSVSSVMSQEITNKINQQAITESSPAAAKAWVIFNGTLANPITPTNAYNMGAITKNGTGDYTLNFTNAMANTNYVLLGDMGRLTANTGTDGRDKFAVYFDSNGTTPILKTTSQVRCQSVSTGAAYNAYDLVAVVYGD
jgi:hypothetical protein